MEQHKDYPKVRWVHQFKVKPKSKYEWRKLYYQKLRQWEAIGAEITGKKSGWGNE